jgi:hypothetical protein
VQPGAHGRVTTPAPVVGLFAAALGAIVLSSCMASMTTHGLGPVADPATERQIDQLAAQDETFAEIQKPVGALDPRLGVYRVLGSKPGVLMLEARDAPVPVPLAQVVSVRTFDRARGAYEVGVRMGAGGFFAGMVTGTLSALSASQPADGGSRPNPGARGLEYGLVGGLVGATLGAALGATVHRGHEDRYRPTPP